MVARIRKTKRKKLRINQLSRQITNKASCKRERLFYWNIESNSNLLLSALRLSPIASMLPTVAMAIVASAAIVTASTVEMAVLFAHNGFGFVLGCGSETFRQSRLLNLVTN